ncbi:hypothetical protein AM228_11655 [Planktothricoides sp. SR001]|nr:hypothetical protein AM228_11655 [Planktothricoides sp. SR001]
MRSWRFHKKDALFPRLRFALGGFSAFPLKAIPASGESDWTTWAKDATNLQGFSFLLNHDRAKHDRSRGEAFRQSI